MVIGEQIIETGNEELHSWYHGMGSAWSTAINTAVCVKRRRPADAGWSIPRGLVLNIAVGPLTRLACKHQFHSWMLATYTALVRMRKQTWVGKSEIKPGDYLFL